MNKQQAYLDRLISKQGTMGVTLRVENGAGEVIYSGAAGNLTTETPYFIASTTKLYTTAIIMRLRAAGRLTLDTPAADILGLETMTGLNRHGGQDHAASITVRQLLAHTSGIPDYFSGKDPVSKRSLEAELLAGSDRGWDFAQSLEWTRQQPASFAPGQGGKALYSDCNFQLLGRICEVLYEGKTYTELVASQIIQPLRLEHTYLYDSATQRPQDPQPLYHHNQVLEIPLAMSSFQADGGIISTNSNSARFLRAFFQGQLFPQEYLAEMCADYHTVFFPIQYGTGLMRYKLPRIFTLFRDTPELLGHSGLSGAFAFYAPSKDLYFTGTVNEISAESRSFRMLVQAVMQF